MKETSAPTIVVEIFVSGPKADIERECAAWCLEVGACVSIEATRFIYTGGIEDGCLVRLLNYPRYPSGIIQIERRAMALAKRLIEATHQHSALVVSPTETTWITRRED